ncbi:MAG: uracil-DNA glycosylase [Acidobacteria bacterium]|nr:uracil-DNA glycosylase [Acidobacteriota bacterium]
MGIEYVRVDLPSSSTGESVSLENNQSERAAVEEQKKAEPVPIALHLPIAMPQTDESRRSTTRAVDRVLELKRVREDLGDCVRCKLHRHRTHIVFGVGNAYAELMFVGEAPGADEDAQGIPFVGRAGQLLTRIIESIGLRREDVYIANIIKCRPPQNRNPELDEIENCSPFLLRQIGILQPRVVCALGKFAAQTLLDTQAPIGQLRGRVFDKFGAKIVPTFHPSYLLRNPAGKREVWEDMKTIRKLLD